MNIQEKLAQRIYELLPHKKELEFGCAIKVIDYSGFGKDSQNKKELLEGFEGNATIVNYSVCYAPRNYDGSPDGDDTIRFQLLVEGVFIELVDVINKDYIDIIGQPIRLADILLVFDNILSDAGVYTKRHYDETYSEIIVVISSTKIYIAI